MVVVVVVTTPDSCAIRGNSAVYSHDYAKLRSRPLLYLRAVLLSEDIGTENAVPCCTREIWHSISFCYLIAHVKYGTAFRSVTLLHT